MVYCFLAVLCIAVIVRWVLVLRELRPAGFPHFACGTLCGPDCRAPMKFKRHAWTGFQGLFLMCLRSVRSFFLKICQAPFSFSKYSAEMPFVSRPWWATLRW